MPSKNLRMHQVLHNSCLDILISVQASVQISNRGKSLNGMEGEHIFIHNTLSLFLYFNISSFMAGNVVRGVTLSYEQLGGYINRIATIALWSYLVLV